MNETSNQYVSNKIRYVGKNTLSDYLLDVYKTSPRLFLKLLFTTNIDILEEVSILSENKIIHMDLKENNIIIDEVLNKPILIDFGLSFRTTDLTESNRKDYFFIYQHYSPWCFEINFINCILNTIVNETVSLSTVIEISDLESICNKFIQDNTFLQSNFNKEDLDAFKKTLVIFVDSFKGKMLKEIIDELMKYSNTWDNYSVAVIYFSIIKENKLDSMGSKLFQDYINLIKSVILSSPDKRPTSNSTKVSLSGLTQRVFKQEKMVIQEKIISNSLDDMFIKVQNKKSALNKLNNLTQQADIHKVRAV
jgi:serine/threonine protein kinase